MLKNYSHTFWASCLGYVTQAIVNNFVPLLFLIFQDEFSLSLEQITFFITVNFTVQLTIDLLSVKIADWLGYRFCAIAAHLFAAAGLCGLAFFPSLFGGYAGLLFAVVLYAVGGGLIEVLISPIVEAAPFPNKASRMSLLHSFYCWGTAGVVFLSSVFLFLCGKTSWRLLACLWAILPLLNAVYFCFVPICRLTEKGKSLSLKALFSRKVFWIFLLLMVAAGASEQAMSQWSSAFAESGLGVSKTVGDLAGPCLFSLLMGLSRLLYAKCGTKVNLPVCMGISGCLCVAAYCLAVFSPVAALSLAGCGLCGFSVGILWPGAFSLASERLPEGGTAMFALLSLAGDLGCMGGPTLVGFVSDSCGGALKAGLFVAILFPAALICLIVLFLKRQKRQKKD